jgi:hypothetical protein
MRFFASILLDTRYALRTMRTQVGLTFVAVGSLALANGGVTAIFSVMYALILRPLPVALRCRSSSVPSRSVQPALQWAATKFASPVR